MKNQILKIAGVKNEKEFYQKFPTEEAFMVKHGGEFEKAQQGKKLSLKSSKLKLIEDNEGYRNPNNQGHPISIDQSSPNSYIDMKGINQSLLALSDNEIRLMHPGEQHKFKGKKVVEFPIAQQGMNLDQQPYQQYNPYFTNNPGWQNAQFPRPPIVQDFESPNIPGQGFEVNNPITTNQQITGDNQFEQQPQAAPIDLMGTLTSALPVVGQVLGGITALGGEKKKRQQAKQMKMISDVTLMASNTRAEEPERRYARPEDAVFSQQEMYPSYGTGTNPLAKNGKKLTKAQLGASLTSMLPGLMGGAQGSPTAMVGSGIANAITGNNAGGMIGGGIGSIFGPLGQIGGTLLGGMLDTNPRKTKRYEQATDRNMQQMAANSQIQSLQANNSSYMQDGGELPLLDGDLETHWGGEATPISYNPHLPNGGETVMFRGNSHDQSDSKGNSGIGITYGNNPVEVETGEPAVVLPGSNGDTNLTIFGNLTIPKQFAEIIGDPKAKNKKFKNYVADLSKKEASHTSLLDKSTEEINTLDMKSPYDKLKFSTLQANILGSNMALKDIASKKTKTAELQSILNNTAEQFNLSADQLANGKIKSAEDGISLIAQRGKTISSTKVKDYLNRGYKQDPNDPSRLYKPGSASITIKGSPEKQSITSTTKKNSSSTVRKAISNGGKPNAQWYSWVKQQLNNGVTYDELASKGHGTIQGLKQRFPNEYKQTIDSIETTTNQEYTPATKDVTTQQTPGDEIFVKDDSNFETVPYKRSTLIDIYNQVLPYIRPTNQEGLDHNQLLGEMNAFATNQLQPVDAQSYQPLLQTPYDISYQDVLNENNADFKSLLKQSNPATQSLLAAQKYQANSKVLGEQFRANQQEKSQVYANNRNTLNDAQLKNLNIFDTQYQRQAQALSNTKAINQSAINSMSSKYQQNKLENRNLGIYENLYNYRYDAAGRAQNFNPLFQANEHNIYSPDSTQPITHVPIKDAKGKIVGYQELESNNISPTQLSPNDFQPIQTTSQTTTEYYKPILPGLGVDTSVGTTARRGKTMSKCTNGSIVSSLKKY